MEKNLITLEDQDLVDRAKSGDKSAIGVLYEKYCKNIKSVAFNILGDKHLAEDVTNEVFLKAQNVITKGRYENDNFKGWILTVCHNLCISHIRKKKIQNTVSDIVIGSGGTEYSLLDTKVSLTENDFLQKGKNSRLMEHLLTLLPKNQGIALSLRFFHGLENKEILKYLGREKVSINTCEGWIKYGLKNLKKIIQKQGGKTIFQS